MRGEPWWNGCENDRAQAWKAAIVRTTWPYSDSRVRDGRPGIVVVNYNTRRLVAQLIYSLYRTLRPLAFGLVVVDNGSTDESAELLSAVAAAGLCDLIANPTNRYHGPGLNQGVSYLARRPSETGRCRSATSGCSTPTVWSCAQTRCRPRLR